MTNLTIPPTEIFTDQYILSMTFSFKIKLISVSFRERKGEGMKFEVGKQKSVRTNGSGSPSSCPLMLVNLNLIKKIARNISVSKYLQSPNFFRTSPIAEKKTTN